MEKPNRMQKLKNTMISLSEDFSPNIYSNENRSKTRLGRTMEHQQFLQPPQRLLQQIHHEKTMDARILTKTAKRNVPTARHDTKPTQTRNRLLCARTLWRTTQKESLETFK